MTTFGDGFRRVPFLETRAAAKEAGVTVEFRKSGAIETLDRRETFEQPDRVTFPSEAMLA